MNSCYGCIYQRKGIWGNNQFCRMCSPEGSNYIARDDFDEWHSSNIARLKAKDWIENNKTKGKECIRDCLHCSNFESGDCIGNSGLTGCEQWRKTSAVC